MNENMRSVAGAKISKALDDVTVAVYTTARTTDADAVHKLRVSIRRFSQAVRVFQQYVPQKPSARIGNRLKKVMKAAGEVRDRDILIGMLDGSGVSTTELTAEREVTGKKLAEISRTIQDAGMPRRWRRRLLTGEEHSEVE